MEPDAKVPTGDAPPSPVNARVYAHSGSMLYKLNPTTLAPQVIGTMGLGSNEQLLDLAVDKDDHIVGTTKNKIYKIDSTTGTATLLADLSDTAGGYTSLSYVPMSDDPNSTEILVTANSAGDVYRIDISGNTANVVGPIGNYGKRGSDQIKSSGDLFGVRGLGIYATVDVGSGTNDYLAKIDPVTWKATLLTQDTGFDHVFGLGFWGDKIYGFVDDGNTANTGKMIQIDKTSGKGTVLTSGAERWFGAGVTTNAAVIF